MGEEKRSEDKEIICRIMDKLKEEGAEAIIGCTELPLIISKEYCKVLLIDTTEVLARVAFKMACEKYEI